MRHTRLDKLQGKAEKKAQYRREIGLELLLGGDSCGPMLLGRFLDWSGKTLRPCTLQDSSQNSPV